MTLIVSLRIPDGIVIAGDSIASMNQQMMFQADLAVTCPQCSHDHSVNVSLQAPPMPGTTFSFAQKVFPLFGKYGVGTYGLGILTGKSIYYLAREFERRSSEEQIDGVTALGKKLGEYFVDIYKHGLVAEGKNYDDLPDKSFVLGFQIVGHDGDVAKTIQLIIGKPMFLKEHRDQAGCTVTGQDNVVAALRTLYKDENESPVYEAFSLQDAVEYAEFLINTTATHQRFSRKMPGVGGSIDIALVTPFSGFQWIRQKSITQLLERENRK